MNAGRLAGGLSLRATHQAFMGAGMSARYFEYFDFHFPEETTLREKFGLPDTCKPEAARDKSIARIFQPSIDQTDSRVDSKIERCCRLSSSQTE